MRIQPDFRHGPVSLAVVLVLAGCGGGGGEAPLAASDQSERATTQASASVEPATTAGSGSEPDRDAAPTFGLEPVSEIPPDSVVAEAPASASVPTPASKLRVAALYFGNLGTVANQQEVARYDFVITNLYGSKSYMQGVINTMRQVNPGVKIASYTNLIEMNTDVAATDTLKYPGLQAINANNWWTRNAAGQLAQWTTAYGTYLVNPTAWAPKDASGRRWPQVQAQVQTNAVMSQVSGLDYIYVDNVWHQPRGGSLDWKRNGTNQLRTDPEIQSALRQGMADYWTALRSLNPSAKIIGNADNDLSMPEYKGKLEGAFLECGLGKSWSFETWGGWSKMMSEYRAMLANTKAPHDVVLQGCGPNGLDLNMLRYGLASALLEDGWFAYTIKAGVPYRADEYSANLGAAAEAPPTAPTSSGIWLRRYANGMVLVNPGTTTASVNIGAGYKRLLGTQDPVTNNGQPVSTVTLLPKQGLIVVTQSSASES